MADGENSFDGLANQILVAGGVVGPSELHGFICGLLSAGNRPEKARWQKEIAGFLDLDAVPADLSRDTLKLAEDSQKALTNGDFSFQPLLSTADDLAERGQSLCQWCAGFLHGFGVGKFTGKLLPTSSEAMKDLAEIANLDSEQMENSPEQEAELFEVQEYVRMAVLNIFVECRGSQDTSGGPTLH